MTAAEAPQLIGTCLDLVDQGLQDLNAQSLAFKQRALSAEFR